MGAAGDKMKSCCAHGPCEFEQVTDRVQLAPVLTEQAVASASPDAKNKDIIACHMRSQSKSQPAVPARDKIPEDSVASAPRLNIKVQSAFASFRW